MPSLTGGNSSGRDYAPHMYIQKLGSELKKEGLTDDDFTFVGHTGSVEVFTDGTEFHIGATALGEIFCDAKELTGIYWNPYIFIHGLPHQAIPKYVLRIALDKALDKDAGSIERQWLIHALLRAIPDFAGIEVVLPSAPSIAEIFEAGGGREEIWSASDAFDCQLDIFRARLGFE